MLSNVYWGVKGDFCQQNVATVNCEKNLFRQQRSYTETLQASQHVLVNIASLPFFQCKLIKVKDSYLKKRYVVALQFCSLLGARIPNILFESPQQC